MDIGNDVKIFLWSIVYAALGVILLFIGYKLFDLLTPTDLDAAIFEKANVAVGLTVGFFVLGLAVVIGAAIHG